MITTMEIDNAQVPVIQMEIAVSLLLRGFAVSERSAGHPRPNLHAATNLFRSFNLSQNSRRHSSPPAKGFLPI
jgi:hypothetical protein